MNEQPQNHKEIIALIKRISGQANFIGTPRIYVDIFNGDLIAAVWFNQVVYWDGKTTEPIGFYKTYFEWRKELGLSEFQVRRVANLCQLRGLVNITFKKVYGTPKNHYLVVWPELLKVLRKTLDNPEPLETEGSETKGSENQGSEPAQTPGSMEGKESSGSLGIEEIPTKSEEEKIWESITEQLKSDMLRNTFEKHVLPARPIEIDPEGWLLVAVDDEDSLQWAEQRLATTVDRLLIGLVPDRDVRVKFVVAIKEPL